MSLLLGAGQRAELWTRLIAIIEEYATGVAAHRVTPELAPRKIRALLEACDFAQPMNAVEALDLAAKGLWEYQTHTPHPRYYGLFNPAPTTMGIAADALAAAFNPQLAAWSHSPFAIEVEQHLIRCFGEKFGFEARETDGAFTSGGAEANHTALLAALTRAFPEYALRGARSLAAQPVFYASIESHHSFSKAARASGIGAESQRTIAVDADLRMRPDALRAAIESDRAAGYAPFMIVATAGATNSGAIDPLPALADIAQSEALWFHADAAWGGAVALVPEMRGLLAGIERADSITFDAHKWLSVPMGAGLFLTRHPEILDLAFRTETAYMPREAAALDVIDPHLKTLQWSRRAIGLKVFLSLLAAGWDGYTEAIRHQTRMGDLLRSALSAEGWKIENQTALPVICFSDPGGADAHAMVMHVVESGEAWISTTLLADTRVLRACITNYRTGPRDIEALVASLAGARDACRTGSIAQASQNN